MKKSVLPSSLSKAVKSTCMTFNGLQSIQVSSLRSMEMVSSIFGISIKIQKAQSLIRRLSSRQEVPEPIKISMILKLSAALSGPEMVVESLSATQMASSASGKLTRNCTCHNKMTSI